MINILPVRLEIQVRLKGYRTGISTTFVIQKIKSKKGEERK
jgi:hypothetical protein